MPDSLKDLCDMLDGLRVTFDRRRDITRPCWLCDAPANPTHKLVSIGTYHNGGDISRPVCEACLTILSAPTKTNA